MFKQTPVPTQLSCANADFLGLPEQVRLEPLEVTHANALESAAADGQLWHLRITSVPKPGDMQAYIEAALDGLKQGHMVPFVVRHVPSNQLIGSTRYHDIVADVARLEIGYTWYAQSHQRTAVNTTCKLLLLTHAFEVLGAKVVGWRTDCFNYASQRAIERLGAKRDGVIRNHTLRRDGTIRDTVFYSLLSGEWPESKAHLMDQLMQHVQHTKTAHHAP